MNWNISQWGVRQVGDRWCVSKFQQERMRIDVQGNLSIGDGPLECGPEVYEFDTEQAAWAQLKFCEKTERIWSELFDPCSTLSFSDPMHVHGGLVVGSALDWYTFTTQSPGQKPLFRVDQFGQIMHVDLPQFVWFWLKRTPLIRGLKAFWYGWGK